MVVSTSVAVMPFNMKATLSAVLALSTTYTNAASIVTHKRSEDAQHLLQNSMTWLDSLYDPSVGYMHEVTGQSAMRHNTRSSAWYALGLLARGDQRGRDVKEAEKIIVNLARDQFKDPSQQWYGDYQKYPEEPVVGSTYYEPSIYNTWDPNVSSASRTIISIGGSAADIRCFSGGALSVRLLSSCTKSMDTF